MTDTPRTCRDKGIVRLFLAGDVMTGRGIDQILAHPGDPTLHEPYVRDAREYVLIAERSHGKIDRPVDGSYIWGDALAELERFEPHARIINLETSVTTNGLHWPAKEIHYRMHPRNFGCISSAKIDCCTLANNHVMDWGYQGLEETLQTLAQAAMPSAGAGSDAEKARRPAILGLPHGGRVLVFSIGSDTSGIPHAWAASENRAGVWLVTDLNPATAEDAARNIKQQRQPGDLVVASIHWGGNWGYEIAPEQRSFARKLIEAGVDLVHGHSSHHPKAMEICQGRLVLYGCGDLINDYEGIGGHETFRPDLSVMYLVELDAHTGRLLRLRLVPMCMRKFRLVRASDADRRWLRVRLHEQSQPFGIAVRDEDEHLQVGSIS